MLGRRRSWILVAWGGIEYERRTRLTRVSWFLGDIHGAGNEARTRDLNLGKVALYQLSYSRAGQRKSPPSGLPFDLVV
jgi:hypothetical protein